MNQFTQQDSAQHKCPNCGAPLRFDPQQGQLFCDHCQSVVNFDHNLDVKEREFADLVTFQRAKQGEVTCFRCDNCGATSVASRTALATSCPYCGSPVVLDDATGSIVKPDTVIPFELTCDDAVNQLLDWRKRNFFAPRKFRKHVSADSVKGVYIPVWTFDAATSTDYIGQVGYHRTRTIHRNGKTYTETYTEWRHISGTIDMSFDDITVRANENIPESFFNRLKPFPREKYRVYDDEYLAGFLADHYSLEPLDAFKQAQNVMRGKIRRAIVQRYHADIEGNVKLDMHFESRSFKYLLVPVYVAATKYRNKIYNQYVSGVFDGGNKKAKVFGKAPTSVWKVLLAFLLLFAIFAAFYLLAYCIDFAEQEPFVGSVPQGFFDGEVQRLISSRTVPRQSDGVLSACMENLCIRLANLPIIL